MVLHATSCFRRCGTISTKIRSSHSFPARYYRIISKKSGTSCLQNNLNLERFYILILIVVHIRDGDDFLLAWIQSVVIECCLLGVDRLLETRTFIQSLWFLTAHCISAVSDLNVHRFVLFGCSPFIMNVKQTSIFSAIKSNSLEGGWSKRWAVIAGQAIRNQDSRKSGLRDRR